MSNGTTNGNGLTDEQILGFCANAAKLIQEQVELLNTDGQAENARRIIARVAEDVQRATSRESLSKASKSQDEPQTLMSLAATTTVVCCSTCYPRYEKCIKDGRPQSVCQSEYNTCMSTCSPSC